MTAPPHHPAHQQLFDWLVDGAPGAKTPMLVVARLGALLREGGLPADRILAFVRTLHPHVAGRRFSWEPGFSETKVDELPWSATKSPAYLQSPVVTVFETGVEIRRSLAGTAPLDFQGLEDFRRDGLTDYIALPMKFMGGTVNVISFSTKAPGGFTDAQLDVLRWIVRPLSRVGETLALMRTAVNLLNTYVGRNAGERILNGAIHIGDTETIRAVIWFSDLRGFTTLSGGATPAETIAMLNELFECQVASIETNGGEVLKFIGDGMLAIFPITEKSPAQAAAAAAVKASREAKGALDALNAARAGRGQHAITFGVALHTGDIAYGNIGGANRLDFTAIGSAVNLASRIEGLTGKLGKFLLMSDDVARLLAGGTRPVGTFELKGVAEPRQVHELA